MKEVRSLLQLGQFNSYLQVACAQSVNPLVEKGNDPWHRDREPLLKKLKKTETQLAGPRPTNASHSRSGSVAESASPTETSDSDSEGESGYYSESDVEVEPEEPSPLPTTRPADPNKAVEYDLIKAVWAKKSVGLSSIIIRTALPECWEIFKGIRDKWKAKVAAVQTAIDKKDQANIKAQERRVQEQRRLLESCIHLTLRHGHPDLIEKYVSLPFHRSQHPLLALCVAFSPTPQVTLRSKWPITCLAIADVNEVNAPEGVGSKRKAVVAHTIDTGWSSAANALFAAITSLVVSLEIWHDLKVNPQDVGTVKRSIWSCISVASRAGLPIFLFKQVQAMLWCSTTSDLATTLNTGAVPSWLVVLSDCTLSEYVL